MQASDLSTKALRAFVALADAGTLSGAARIVNRSESAVSLQVASLESALGAALFVRTGRRTHLSPFGSQFLIHANEILSRIDEARLSVALLRPSGPLRIGLVQDLVGLCIPPILAHLSKVERDPFVAMSVGTSAELSSMLSEEQLDIAVLGRRFEEPDTVITLPMKWLSQPGYEIGARLVLAGVSPPCPFHDAATKALMAVGRSFAFSFESPNLDAVCNAVSAGAGVICRTELLSRNGFCEVPKSGTNTDLPDLPSISYVVETKRVCDDHVSAVAIALRSFLRAQTLGDIGQEQPWNR